jgi:hypothetical protein
MYSITPQVPEGEDSVSSYVMKERYLEKQTTGEGKQEEEKDGQRHAFSLVSEHSFYFPGQLGYYVGD